MNNKMNNHNKQNNIGMNNNKRTDIIIGIIRGIIIIRIIIGMNNHKRIYIIR